MPLVLSFANLNPYVDLKANVFRERNTNVIRSLQDFTAIPRKDFMKNDARRGFKVMQRLMSYMDSRHPFTETLYRNRIEIV